MKYWELVFGISCFIVFFNYAGYAIIVYILNKLKKPNNAPLEGFNPTVSFIVAAYNEEDIIQEKILNSLQQNYPLTNVEFIFITDGSTDKTAEIIAGHTDIQLLHVPERSGKSAALNRAIKGAKNEILIFSDANTLLNKDAIKNITRHYADPTIGGVAGEKKVISLSANADEVGAGEGLYWKYESFLKKIDAEFYSVVGAAGELFSLRSSLYEPIPANVILDDFVISLRVAEKGYRIMYEPQAYAMETPSFSIKDEQKRKIRIAAGGFQAIGMLGNLFLFWRYPRLSFLYISHRVLRWTLSPLCLLLAFISNLILFFGTHNYLFKILFILQLVFYIMAFAAKYISSDKSWFKIFKLAYYFAFMNISVIQGFFRFIRGRQSATWEKAKRTKAILDSK